MYPYLSTLRVIWNARQKSPIKLNESSTITLRAGFLDIDNYGEINNGRQLTLMDLGRYDLGVRVGLMDLVKAKKWGLAVGGFSVRFRRRIPWLHKFELRSRVVGHDGRWFYFHQETWCKDQICSSALIKAGVISKAGLVPAPEVIEALPKQTWDQELPQWVQAWVDIDFL